MAPLNSLDKMPAFWVYQNYSPELMGSSRQARPCSNRACVMFPRLTESVDGKLVAPWFLIRLWCQFRVPGSCISHICCRCGRCSQTAIASQCSMRSLELGLGCSAKGVCLDSGLVLRVGFGIEGLGLEDLVYVQSAKGRSCKVFVKAGLGVL